MESKESFVKKESGSREGLKASVKADLADLSKKALSEEARKEKPKKKTKETQKAPSLEELKKEKIMSKEEADKEIYVMTSVKPNEKRPNVGFVPSSLTEKMTLGHLLEEDGKAGRISNLYRFFFVNNEEKMFSIGEGRKELCYKADMVFYCELGDGNVKRMYLSANEFVPLTEDVSFEEGYVRTTLLLHILGMEEARGICGFKESSPKSQ